MMINDGIEPKPPLSLSILSLLRYLIGIKHKVPVPFEWCDFDRKQSTNQ